MPGHLVVKADGTVAGHGDNERYFHLKAYATLLCLLEINFTAHDTMKKILLVFTGGTIGSAAMDGTIDTSDAAPFRLLQLFKQQYHEPDAVRFNTLQPIQILSENLAPAVWQIIIEAIESAQPDNYDGIIVTHGTDTLAYSAAALGFYFHALARPLLLVSSDYPLDNPKANGLANFICAVEFIRQHIATGVFVPYRNAGQTMQIHSGTHLTCSLQLSGNFYSVQNKSFMQFDGQQFSCSNDTEPATKIATGENIPLKPQFSNRILMIKPYPGLDYSHFNLDEVDAVLHDLYHSGTACSSEQWGKNLSLIEFLKRCKQQQIPVYLAPAIKSENTYQSTAELIGQGAEMIWNMSIEAAYVKLVLAYGNFYDQQQIRNFLSNDVANEFLHLI
jgi:L-asparaginase/Glu-tRNA(Gln) amidotransferase subunit D